MVPGNFRFFDAPAVAFFMLPDGFGLREACDLGMFTQTVMLGLTAQGLGSCPQTALGFMAKQIREIIEVPEHHKLMFGLSFGYPVDTPINDVVTDRTERKPIRVDPQLRSIAMNRVWSGSRVHTRNRFSRSIVTGAVVPRSGPPNV